MFNIKLAMRDKSLCDLLRKYSSTHYCSRCFLEKLTDYNLKFVTKR